MKRRKVDVVVIGCGPAGLAAGAAARRGGARKVLVVDRDDQPGGILNQCIHNGFGLHYYGEDLTGPEYAARHLSEAVEVGVEILMGAFVYRLESDRTVRVSQRNGLLEVRAGAIVLAMGCRERTRESLPIHGDRPSGVMTAGEAQRLVNIEGVLPGRRVVILGAGDIGLIMARRLKLEGLDVIAVVDIAERPGGLPRNIVQCLNDFGIPLWLRKTVVQIEGRERLEQVTIADVDETGAVLRGSEQRVACDLLLLAVGLIPENELSLQAGIELDQDTGGAVVDQWRMTSCPGIFAAGNVVTVHDLVDWASREGWIAGMAAANYARGKFPVTVSEPGLQIQPEGHVALAVPQRLRRPWRLDQLRSWFFVIQAQTVLRGARLRLSMAHETLASRKLKAVRPGESLVLDIPTVDLDSKTGPVILGLEGAI